jgi:thioredoxin reductase (NADPH)
MDRFRKQAERFGTVFASGALTGVDLSRRPFALTLDDGIVHAETLIVATGARARWLGLPEEMEFRTKIGGVSACATCDGFFYTGKEVLVVGGGDTAMEEATFLTKFAPKVTVVHRRRELRASKIMADRALAHAKIEFVWDSAVVEVLGDDKKVTAVRVKNVVTGDTVERPCGGFFVAIGHVPNTQLFENRLAQDGQGYLKIQGDHARTEIEGVFIAGDVHDHVYRQAVTAAGAGCRAAIDADRWLEAQ